MSTKNYFITGTDTSVGKTLVTCALLIKLQAKGIHTAAMKPVASGTIEVDGELINEDVAAIRAVTRRRSPLRDVNPYCLTEAVAPHIASVHENMPIETSVIADAFARLSADSDCVLVEGAGGFLVPLNAIESMASIPALLKLEVILVVGMRLGCLSHALLTAEAIRARGYNLTGWVANSVAATPMPRLHENIASLKLLLRAPWLGTIPYLVSSQDGDGISQADMIERARAAATYLQIDSLFTKSGKLRA